MIAAIDEDYARPPLPRPGYVYVASSWRNPYQQAIVAVLKAAGIDCYDFREPEPGVKGFAWSDIDPYWKAWSAKDYVEALKHPIAEDGFRRDFEAMQRADTFVLVLPCGRSAHLELGWAVGAGKRTCILTHDGEESELMAKMVDHIAIDTMDLLAWLGGGGLMRNEELEVQAIYKHPQGKTIKVFADGTFECRGPDGKKKSTSATPEKLARGYGTWKKVT